MNDEFTNALPMAPVTASAPDWSTVGPELHCPLCEYNLRGLIEPRCPECGYQFEWAVLLNPSLQVHPYLFEHHPKHSIRSFRQTVIGGLRPSKFWTSLKPVQTVYPRRLIAYFAIVSCVSVLTMAATALILLGARELAGARHTPYFQTHRINPLPFRLRFRSTGAWWDTFVVPLAVGVEIVVLAWQWLTQATLMIFQGSIRRIGIKNVHLLRCTIYSADVILWAHFAALVAAVVSFVVWFTMKIADPNRVLTPNAVTAVFFYFLLPIWAVFCYRLYVAYRKYLQFSHVIATLIASQIIVALTIPAAAILWAEISSHF